TGGGPAARLGGRPPLRTPPVATPPPAAGAAAGAAEGGGGGTPYRFQALQEVDVPQKNAAVFDLCWRTMRDPWYDDRLGNKDWEAVRRKYIDMAAQAPDMDTLSTVVHLMLGELNGSHLGFTPLAGAAPVRRRLGPTAPAGATSWAEV